MIGLARKLHDGKVSGILDCAFDYGRANDYFGGQEWAENRFVRSEPEYGRHIGAGPYPVLQEAADGGRDKERGRT